jgi:hypothetical protein
VGQHQWHKWPADFLIFSEPGRQPEIKGLQEVEVRRRRSAPFLINTSNPVVVREVERGGGGAHLNQANDRHGGNH